MEKFTKSTEANFVRCRDVGIPFVKARKVWAPGKPVEFQWMPGGVHTITASYGRGENNVPIELTVLCDEAAADRVARSFDEIKANNPRRPPFICIEHKAKERAGEPISFRWGEIVHDNGRDVGIVCTTDPSSLGATNVNGKIHTSFSPTFDTDADYDALRCSCCGKPRKDCGCDGSVFTFAAGKRGSRENPAHVTRLDAQSVGSLTNWNAFKDILPVAAREPDGSGGDAPEKKAAEQKRRTIFERLEASAAAVAKIGERSRPPKAASGVAEIKARMERLDASVAKCKRIEPTVEDRLEAMKKRICRTNTADGHPTRNNENTGTR